MCKSSFSESSLKQKVTHNIKASNKNLEILRNYFPHCFVKGEFDFNRFKQELNAQGLNPKEESYGIDWLGKSYARLLASDEATTLLEEDEEFNERESNKETENLLIKGDNLEVLKHLSNAYHERIKMIYIDPPYNTGTDGFIYKDDKRFNSDQLVELAGISSEEAKRILDFTQSKSNSHSAYLTFMYPRLYIAKQLLTNDGVIFISIDDNEQANLKILCDEIFGEENFVGTLIHQRAKGGGMAKHLVKAHDYIHIYCSDINKITLQQDKIILNSDQITKKMEKILLLIATYTDVLLESIIRQKLNIDVIFMKK